VERVLQCDCGFEARAEHEDGLVAEVRRHARETHGMVRSHNEALLLAFRVELDAPAPPGKSASQRADDPSPNPISDREEEK